MIIETKDKSGKWVACEHKSWKELIDEGWLLTEIRSNVAIMVRNGYINEFRNQHKIDERVCNCIY